MWVFGQAQIWMFMERYAEAEARLDALVNVARAQHPFHAARSALHARRGRRRLGRPAEAVADATEARAQRGYRAAVERRSGSMAARVDRRAQGRSADCRGHVAGMLSLKGPSEAESLRIYSSQALGFLALGAGELDEAAHHLSAVDLLHRETGGAHPLIDSYEQDLIEVLIRLGRVEEADGALATFAAQAGDAGPRGPPPPRLGAAASSTTTRSRTTSPRRWRGTPDAHALRARAHRAVPGRAAAARGARAAGYH